MAEQPTVDQAVERAMRVQDDKIATIRELAKGRQALTDLREETARKLAELERQNAEQIGTAEREDVRLYSAATKAGWSTSDLRKIGFDAPAKSRRVASKKQAAVRPTDSASGAGRVETPDG